MPFVTGFLRIRRRGHIDNSLPGSGGEVDNSLPGVDGPVDPDYGIEEGHPDQGLPGYGGLPPMAGHLPATQPPGVWPPLRPSHPIEPAPPGTPPGTIWPSPGAPDHTLPTPPGVPPRPDNTLPSKTYWVVAGIPGIGWRYVAVDPSLKPSHPAAGLPGAPQPKT
jgi:hypothetical protein